MRYRDPYCSAGSSESTPPPLRILSRSGRTSYRAPSAGLVDVESAPGGHRVGELDVGAVAQPLTPVLVGPRRRLANHRHRLRRLDRRHRRSPRDRSGSCGRRSPGRPFLSSRRAVPSSSSAMRRRRGRRRVGRRRRRLVVVVLADGGAASVVCGDGLLSPPLKINTDASTAATPNSTTVAAASATCVRAEPRLPCAGAAAAQARAAGGGYGVYPVPDGFS